MMTPGDGKIPAGKVEYWASLGNVERVKEALSQGADVNEAASDNYTALHGASENGHVDVVRILLLHGAKVDARTGSGHTALDLALLGDQKDVAALLRSHGGISGKA
jgi:ankyrin repeat protein